MLACYFCHAVCTKDGMGVWVGQDGTTHCDGSPTGFHHPEGTPMGAEGTEDPLDLTRANLPDNTVMFVIALNHGTYYSTMSQVVPGGMHKIEAAAMLHQIANGWEREAVEEIAQQN